MPPLTRTAALAAAGLALAALAGCGGGSTGTSPTAGGTSTSLPASTSSAKTAPPATTSSAADPSSAPNGMADAPDAKVLAAANAAFRQATSVHIAGDIVSGGTKIHLDLEAGQGRTGRGKVTLGDATFDVIATQKDVYLGGDDSFWKQAGGKGAAALFRGKYLKTTRTSKDFADVAAFFDLGDLSKNLLPSDGLGGTKTETLRGVPVRVLGDAGNTRYAVATVGTPYPLEFSGTEGTDRIALTFDRYGEKLDLTPPPADKIVDTADFKK